MIYTKRIFIVLLLLGFSFLNSRAQINWGDYSQSSAVGVMEKPSTVGIIINIPKLNNSFWVNNVSSKYFYRLEKDTVFKKQHAKNTIARTTFDTAKVHFFLHGVNKKNAADYQYRVMEYPNRILDPWMPISRFTDSTVIKHSGISQIAYLGGYSAKLSNMIIVDVKKVGSEEILSTALVAWEAISPVVTNIYTSDTYDSFLQRLQHPWSNQALEKKAPPQQNMELPSSNTQIIFFLKADIYHRNQVQYQLLKEGKVIIAWRNNDYDNSFIWIKENKPGKYKVNIRFTAQPQHITTYNFEIKPAWYQSNWFKIISGSLILAFLGFLLFILLLIRQKRLTRNEMGLKTKLQLELKAIHAQLNPHFVFNALSSIQGLINKKDIKSANDYLADFAKLMRESLKSGNKEEQPLSIEITVLDTYLRLEKLRFGFEYQFMVDEKINTHEINIPSLLLQPLVENSIKHGISVLPNGKIEIYFNRVDDTLVVLLKDNGTGFNLSQLTGGYGLKLTHERINLLNKLKPEQPIVFEVESSTKGTKITLTFNHWFL